MQYRIGLIIDDTIDNNDGVQQYVKLLAKYLVNTGNTVYIITSESSIDEIHGAKILACADMIGVKFNKNKLSMPIRLKKDSMEKIKELNLDLLHITMPYSPLLCGRIIKELNIPTVATFLILGANGLANIGSKLLGIYQTKNLEYVNEFISVSEPSKKYLKKYFKKDSKYIPIPIEDELVIDNSNKTLGKELKIVFLGRFVERKGLNYLLESVNLLKSLNPDAYSKINLDIYGGGELESEYTKYIADNNLKNVQLKGFMPEDKKIETLSKYDIAIYPSTGGESFGIVLLEAMASGVLTLGANNDGYSSTLNHNHNWIFDSSSALSIAKKLLEYFNDNQKYIKELKAQREYLDKYLLSVVADDIQQIYEKAMKDYAIVNK